MHRLFIGPLKVPSEPVSEKSTITTISIQTVWFNFYPDGGSGVQHGQFLSGYRIWHTKNCYSFFFFRPQMLIFWLGRFSGAPIRMLWTSRVREGRFRAANVKNVLYTSKFNNFEASEDILRSGVNLRREVVGGRRSKQRTREIRRYG